MIGRSGDRPTVGPDEQGAADAVTSLPGPRYDPAHVADAGDPQLKVARDGCIIVKPQLTIGFLYLVVSGGDGPGRRGENQVGTHPA